MKAPVHEFKNFVHYADDYRPPYWSFDGRPCWLASGIKDINNREIFEGDIVIFENKEYPVVFHDCEFYLHETAGDLPLSTFESYELEIFSHIDEEDNQ